MKPLLQNVRWIGIALFALILGAQSSDCAAAPLTLRGTATVATAANVLNSDLSSYTLLPLSVSAGDTFDFQLSIDTELSPGDPPSEPPGYRTAFSAKIGGTAVVDEDLVVQIFDDSLIYSRNLAEIIPIDSTGAYGDQISNYSLRYSGRIISTPAAAFYTTILFTSQLSRQPPFSSLLSSTNVPDGSTTWQSFSQRELALTFDNRTFLGAYITTIAVVPEPSTLAICGCCLPWLGSRFVRRRPYLTSAART